MNLINLRVSAPNVYAQFSFDRQLVDFIKTAPDRLWNGQLKAWIMKACHATAVFIQKNASRFANPAVMNLFLTTPDAVVSFANGNLIVKSLYMIAFNEFAREHNGQWRNGSWAFPTHEKPAIMAKFQQLDLLVQDDCPDLVIAKPVKIVEEVQDQHVEELSDISASGFKLFRYQADAVKAAIDIVESTSENCGLIVAPTGAGKTVIAAAIADGCMATDAVDVVIIIDHRLDLSRQNAPKIGAKWVETGIDLRNLVIQKGDKVLISAQLLQREENATALLEKTDGMRILGIFDEAHHYVDKSWGNLRNHFPKYVGLTATPFRTDNLSVVGAFGRIIYKITYNVLWKAKRLAPANLSYIDTTVSVKVHKTETDLEVVEIKAEDERIRDDVILNAVTTRLNDTTKPPMKALLFAESLGTAERFSTIFNEAQVTNAVISYKVKAPERIAAFSDFHAGKVQLLLNYEVLTEGFDEPSVNTIFFARPTSSAKIAMQCIGRGLRIDPANPAKICDIVMFADKVVDANNPDAIIDTLDLSAALTGVAGEVGDLAKIAEEVERNPRAFVHHAARIPGPKNSAWFKINGYWYCLIGCKPEGTGHNRNRYTQITLTETPEYRMKAEVKQWKMVWSEKDKDMVKCPTAPDRQWILNSSPGDPKMFAEAMQGVSLAGKKAYELTGISEKRNAVLEKEYGKDVVSKMSADEKLFRLAVHFREIKM